MIPQVTGAIDNDQGVVKISAVRCSIVEAKSIFVYREMPQGL